MTPAQARALLELIADLYRVASEPEPEPVTNGKVPEPKAEPAIT